MIFRKATKKTKTEMTKTWHKIDRLSTSDTSRRDRAFPQNSRVGVTSQFNTPHELWGMGRDKILKHNIQGSISSVPNLFF